MKTIKRMIAAAVIVAVSSLLSVVCSPSARAQQPTGSDVVTSLSETNITITLASTTNGTITATTNVTVLAANPKRVRATITPDAGHAAYLNYGPEADGTTYLTTTNGDLLAAGGSNWQTVRPALWKDALSVYLSQTFTTNGTTNVTFKIKEESGSY